MDNVRPARPPGGMRAQALVLVHAHRDGLWDRELRRLAADVSARLPGIYVVCAATNGRGPALRDALAAARYAGCSSAVLVHLDDTMTAAPALDHGLHLQRASAPWSSVAVVAAFQAASTPKAAAATRGAA